jgi:hypothetical protein
MSSQQEQINACAVNTDAYNRHLQRRRITATTVYTVTLLHFDDHGELNRIEPADVFATKSDALWYGLDAYVTCECDLSNDDDDLDDMDEHSTLATYNKFDENTSEEELQRLFDQYDADAKDGFRFQMLIAETKYCAPM